MKISEFRKLIREEVRKVLNEAITWDKKAIEKFFKYLLNNHGIRSKPVFKTDTSGRVEIYRMIAPPFKAKFMVDGNNLIFNPTPDSEMTAKDFVEDIEYDGAEGYKFKVKKDPLSSNKSVIVNAENSIELGSGKIVKNVSVDASGIKFGNKSISFDTINHYFSTKPGKEGLVAKLVEDSELLQRVMIEAELGISDEEGVGDALKTEDPKLAYQLKALVKFSYL